MSDIDGIDLFRPVLQHAVRKASGRRTDIHTDITLQCDREARHRLFQLQTAAAHITQRASLYRDRHLRFIEHGSRLVLSLSLDKDLSRHNHSLGFFS